MSAKQPHPPFLKKRCSDYRSTLLSLASDMGRWTS